MEQERLQELIGSDYTLQWVIGHGGMSTVWLADDNVHQREVAIKVLRPEFSDNREFLGRFRNEAQSAQQIDSDNVVATYDYRELKDTNGAMFCFMALEYVRGESLADLLAREGALPEALALDVMEQAAHGLSVIHRMGMVHRDIKPGNLLITQNGQVKVTDFGIAKAAAAVPLTRTGMVVGTAQYVSPEQAQGHAVSPASDVYSLGVVGYEMLSGKRPFSGDSSVSVALAHISKVAEPLPTTISAQARELIGIALRKDAARRYADGNEFALAISQVRFGKRPPEPAGAPVPDIAEPPSPTASTEMLANAAQPTTTQPAAVAVSEKKPILPWILGAAALLGGGIWAATALTGGDDGESTEPTSADPIVVTETVSSTEDEQPGDSTAPAAPTKSQRTPTHRTHEAPTEQLTVTETKAPAEPPAEEEQKPPAPVDKTTQEEQPEFTTQAPATTEAPNTVETEVNPLDSLSVNPTHFATNPSATL